MAVIYPVVFTLGSLVLFLYTACKVTYLAGVKSTVWIVLSPIVFVVMLIACLGIFIFSSAIVIMCFYFPFAGICLSAQVPLERCCPKDPVTADSVE